MAWQREWTWTIGGVLAITATWAILWAGFFATLVATIAMLDPDSVDPGEGPLDVSRIGLGVGAFSGFVYGTLLAIAERGKQIASIAIGRVALWGALAGASWPLVSRIPESQVLLVGPLGVLCAVAPFLIARRAEAIDGPRGAGGFPLGRIPGLLMQLACGSRERNAADHSAHGCAHE